MMGAIALMIGRVLTKMQRDPEDVEVVEWWVGCRRGG
jgi:hypothetical protein